MPEVLESGTSASLSASFGCVQEGCTGSEPHSPGCSAPRQLSGASPYLACRSLPAICGHWVWGHGKIAD